MTVTLPKVIADFTTTIVNSVAVGDTTATLTSVVDQDGVTAPTGMYGLTIDRKNSKKEYYQCTLTGTSLTNIKTVTRGTAVATAGFARAHRKGAEVIISDWFVLKRIVDLLDGTTGFDSAAPIKYDAHPTFNADAQIVDKKYVDDLVVAGSPDASTTTKGISKLSSAPVSPTDPIAVGDNDGRVPTQGENDALAGTSGTPSTTNKFVTENDTTNLASQTGTGISFTAATKTIADSGNGFVTSGFRVGASIIVSGTASNDGTYTIVSVAAGAIVVAETLVDESAGSSFTIEAAKNNKVIRLNADGSLDANTILGSASFLGDGSDGDLIVTSGTTTVDLGAAQVVVKNYTNISITGTGQVQFINPHASGTIIIVKCQGRITLTSSTIPNLDASGCGGAGGAGGTVAGTKTGSNGTNGTSILDVSIHYGAGASSNFATTGGLILSSTTFSFYTRNEYQLLGGINLACGSGGGGGGATDGNGTGGAVTGIADGGAGGNGGAVLLMQCGSLNFTSTLGISVAGAAGTAGGTISSAAGANAVAGSGGGGGAGGMCVILYNTLVAASGTINSAGGAGGAGGAASNTSGGVGGGTFFSLAAGAGAGAYGGAGGAGAASVSAVSTNGTNGSAAGGVQAGGGGGSGAGITYITSATNTGGTGGAGGASAGGLVAQNKFRI